MSERIERTEEIFEAIRKEIVGGDGIFYSMDGRKVLAYAERFKRAALQERIQRDKVSFRCGDCARFGTDCKAGDVDGNEDCVACERFVKRSREPVTNCNGLGNVAKMRKALEAVDQSVSGCSPLLGGDPILKQVVKAALAAPARNCDVCADAQVANARFQKMCDGRGNGLKACTGCKYNDTPDGFPAISRCRVSWLYDTAEVAQ